MKMNLTKKRLFISCVLLLIGVLLLRPYLTSNPQRDLMKSVSALEKPLAVSVMKTVFLGQAIVDKGRDFSYSEAENMTVSAFVDRLSADVEKLKAELLAMPENSAKMTPAAEAAYQALNKELKELILSSSEEGK